VIKDHVFHHVLSLAIVHSHRKLIKRCVYDAGADTEPAVNGCTINLVLLPQWQTDQHGGIPVISWSIWRYIYLLFAKSNF